MVDRAADAALFDAYAPPPGRGVYCNRTLNLRAIKVVGYDMDYTLVHYRVVDWERRAYEHLRARLAETGCPVDDLEFDPELVMRGLVIDTEHGNVLKVNRFGYVKAAYHGSRPMPFEELRARYARTMVDLAQDRWTFLNTLFSLSEGCMYAQLVDRLDAGALGAVRSPTGPLGYRELHQLVRDHIDRTHLEGALKAEIVGDPGRFVDADADTVLALLDQRHSGKKLLLVTNSEWAYTDAMMRYAVERFLPEGMRWPELFELTVVAARKPEFFALRAPLLEVVSPDGLLRPVVGPLKSGGCYFGGHAARLESHLGVSGDEILYLGDHMYGDVHVTKSVLRWRTGLIVRELEDELAAVEASRAGQAELAALMRDKEGLEARYYRVRLLLQRKRERYGPPVDASVEALTREVGRLRAAITAQDDRIAPLAGAAAGVLNHRWGLLMRAGNDKSQLARQIERYADVYTSRVSNLLWATPFAFVRSPRQSLPHDPVLDAAPRDK
ncbi:MAG: HAD-IG family 5'-nucleotidase [Myxococcales bacterium]|nr:HAD-IG family 5'-nucleotidase [Myxococcales bacterium]